MPKPKLPTLIIEDAVKNALQKSILHTSKDILSNPIVKKEIENSSNSDNLSKSVLAVINKGEKKLAKSTEITLINAVQQSFILGEDTAVTKVSSKFKKDQQKAAEIISKSATSQARKSGTNALKFALEPNNGLNISQRVWKNTEGFKNEMQAIIQNGILQGKSADALTKELKQYLNNPDALFRRVRNKKTGELVLSKAAKNYHPGKGVYRSAYKNAMRLARTEINRAYNVAQWQGFQNNPLVEKYEIKLSGNHPVYDICDKKKGIYPKSFKFEGWHPQCRCIMIPKTISVEDFGDFLETLPEQEWVKPNAKLLEKIEKNLSNISYIGFDSSNISITDKFNIKNLSKRIDNTYSNFLVKNKIKKTTLKYELTNNEIRNEIGLKIYDNNINISLSYKEDYCIINLVKVTQNFQNQELSKSIIKELYENWKEQGIRKILLEAISDEHMNGAYTWAKYGFFADNIASILNILPYNSEYYNFIINYVKKSKCKYSMPFDINILIKEFGKKEVNKYFSENRLRYNAFLDFSNQEQMSIFSKYLNLDN